MEIGMNNTPKVIDAVSRCMGSDVIPSINRFVEKTLVFTGYQCDTANVPAAYRLYSSYEDCCVDWFGFVLYIIDNFPGVGVVKSKPDWRKSEYFLTGCKFRLGTF